MEKGEQKKKGSTKKTSNMIVNATKLQNQEQALPADAQLGKEGVEKVSFARNICQDLGNTR